MTDIPPFYPLPTAQVQPYVDVLGVECTIEFLLAFGGAELTFPTSPNGRGMVERVVGVKKAAELAEKSKDTATMQNRVPIANRWLAKCLYAQGLSKSAIARRLRITDVTVGRYLEGGNTPNPRSSANVTAIR